MSIKGQLSLSIFVFSCLFALTTDCAHAIDTKYPMKGIFYKYRVDQAAELPSGVMTVVDGSMTQNFDYSSFWACKTPFPKYTGASWQIFKSPDDSDDFLSYALPLMKKEIFDISLYNQLSPTEVQLNMNSRSLYGTAASHQAILDQADTFFKRDVPAIYDGGGFNMGPSICNTILEYQGLMGYYPRAQMNPKTVTIDFAPGIRSNAVGNGIHGGKVMSVYNFSEGKDSNGWPLITGGTFVVQYSGNARDGKLAYDTAIITFSHDNAYTVRRVLQFLMENPNDLYSTFYFTPTGNYSGESPYYRYQVFSGKLSEINIRQLDNR